MQAKLSIRYSIHKLKETLKTPKQKFGSSYDIPDKFITQLMKTDILDKIQAQAAFKDSQLLSKTDGKKSKKVHVAKLSDANKAGTTESKPMYDYIYRGRFC